MFVNSDTLLTYYYLFIYQIEDPVYKIKVIKYVRSYGGAGAPLTVTKCHTGGRGRGLRKRDVQSL